MRKITITVDDVTLDCLRAMREFGIPCSAAIRRAVWAYYQDNFSYILPVQKNRPSVGSSAAEGDYYAL